MLTILVVDDHKEEREGITFLIEELGFPLKLQVAENGRKALEYLQQHAVDILFTDVRMPQMDGLQLTKQVLQLHPKTKVIIFSGYAEFEYAKTAITLGVSDYLLKPVNVETFEATLKKVIGELTQQQQLDETSQMTQGYVKKHILFTLINGIGGPASIQDILPDLPDYYQGILLLEFEKDFFENAGPQFEDYLHSQLGAAADYLNLNGCQSLLLFPEGSGMTSHTLLREMALRIHNRILLEYKVNCYFSIKNGPIAIDSLAEVLPELEQWMEYRFFLPDTFVFDAKNELLFSQQSFPDVPDIELLEQIRIHLKERNLFSLKASVEVLYQKYDRQVQYSQLYVKHIFSTVYENIMSIRDAAQTEINLGIEKIWEVSLCY